MNTETKAALETLDKIRKDIEKYHLTGALPPYATCCSELEQLEDYYESKANDKKCLS